MQGQQQLQLRRSWAAGELTDAAARPQPRPSLGFGHAEQITDYRFQRSRAGWLRPPRCTTFSNRDGGDGDDAGPTNDDGDGDANAAASHDDGDDGRRAACPVITAPRAIHSLAHHDARGLDERRGHLGYLDWPSSVCHSPHSWHSKVIRSGSPPNRSVLRTNFIGRAQPKHCGGRGGLGADLLAHSSHMTRCSLTRKRDRR